MAGSGQVRLEEPSDLSGRNGGEGPEVSVKKEVTRTPTVAGRQMSASLRERLKRSGRSHSSPVSSKRFRPDATQTAPSADPPLTAPSADSPQTTPSADPPLTAPSADPPQTEPRANTTDRLSPTHWSPVRTAAGKSKTHTDTAPGGSTAETPSTDAEPRNLRLTRLELRDAVARKEERLRKLKMVKMYRAKNDLVTLSRLIAKWRSTSQTALYELLDLTHADPKPTLAQLVRHLGVDPELLQFNLEDESFT